MTRRRNSWASLGASAWQASLDAQQVIALRMAKLAQGGPAASAEWDRMLSEKAATALQVQGAAVVAALTGAGGAIPARTVAAYHRKVRANRRRLLREL